MRNYPQPHGASRGSTATRSIHGVRVTLAENSVLHVGWLASGDLLAAGIKTESEPP